jgi:Cu/Ag efflux pump CusA
VQGGLPLKGILAFAPTRRMIISMGLIAFAGAGFLAYKKPNIEAYPNPAPVILEITAQAAGLSAEEMERYYTIPMGLWCKVAFSTQNPKIGCLKINNLRASIFLL